MKRTIIVLAILMLVGMLATVFGETVRTRLGWLSFTHDFANGYPTNETVEKLYDERDFQRACQCYLWSLPIVSMAQWQREHEVALGAKNGQIVLIESYEDRLGGLTYNATTPYALPFIDLAREGPFVVEMPEGEVRGAAHDFWQIAIYPWSERKSPKPRGHIRPEGKRWLAAQPRGMANWERLADIINREPVFERDRFFMAMLKPLGIEKGKPFDPTPRQLRILTEGALVGEAVAKANDFSKRMEESHYVDGAHWHFATVCNPDQRTEHYNQLDERAAWLYEAVTNNPAMHGQKTGKGQIYLGTYKDADGDWLDGARNYVLRVPADPPAEAFWSITVYDVDTRCLIRNDQKIADRSSLMDLISNEDGSVDIHIGPDAPKGREKNWIPTVAGRAWFPYFRLYSPKPAFLDRTWVLPDIEKRR
jgi:hypothetical protein